jgi:hypothetical protein
MCHSLILQLSHYAEWHRGECCDTNLGICRFLLPRPQAKLNYCNPICVNISLNTNTCEDRKHLIKILVFVFSVNKELLRFREGGEHPTQHKNIHNNITVHND